MTTKLHAEQPIGGLPATTIGDFWAWAYSNVLSNATRGVLAEFLVGAALAAVQGVRVEWDAFDLLYRDCKLEVKSTAFVQSWPQKKLSVPVFTIGEKRSWNAETGESVITPLRAADIFVFCLLTSTDRATVNALELSEWEFYVLSTKHIETAFGRHKTVSLTRLRRQTEAVPFHGLRAAVDACIDLMHSRSSE